MRRSCASSSCSRACSRSPSWRTASSWRSWSSASRWSARPTGAARPRPSSTSPRTSPRPFATSRSTIRSNAKEFSERILEHMSSGVITIGRDQRVGTMNRRAAEILGLPAQTVVGEDLRVLPSPLGDMLYDTLRSSRTVTRADLQLALRGLWLEVSTYPVRGDDPQPLGAVLVFEDLTAQKELAAQRRQGEQTQLLTRVVARIADEIKNPLVSINTFIELIGERYDDPISAATSPRWSAATSAGWWRSSKNWPGSSPRVS